MLSWINPRSAVTNYRKCLRSNSALWHHAASKMVFLWCQSFWEHKTSKTGGRGIPSHNYERDRPLSTVHMWHSVYLSSPTTPLHPLPEPSTFCQHPLKNEILIHRNFFFCWQLRKNGQRIQILSASLKKNPTLPPPCKHLPSLGGRDCKWIVPMVFYRACQMLASKFVFVSLFVHSFISFFIASFFFSHSRTRDWW